MSEKLALILGLVIALGGAAAQAGPAVAGGPFACPFGDWDNWYMTAAFDLDPSTAQADWTGWASGDPTGGSGHAYDGHTGTDFGMPTGTALYACQNGTVNSLYEGYPNDDHSGGGNYLILDHSISGTSWRSRYWHLQQNGVVPGVGNSVTMGQLVAYSDNTGNSTGPHLHFALAKLSASGANSCGFLNGWLSDDEFYYGSTRPCLVYTEVTTAALNIRLGASTSYPILTSASLGGRLVASQRNGWWRIFLPSAPARALESRTTGGGVTAAPSYVETGAWTSDSAKTAVADALTDANRVALTGVGSRSNALGGSDTARFVPTLTQRALYNVLVSWPSAANAQNVRYTVSHLTGLDAAATQTTTSVTLSQRGAFSAPGAGTHASPHVIEQNPYLANHTTLGGDDIWNSYSPVGSGIPENGPERIYTFTLLTTATVTATVAHSGYPGLDVDVQLLNSQSNADCQARGDWTASHTYGPGTHFIAIDSYGTDNSRAAAYTLTVTFGDTEPFANSWVSLGTYAFDIQSASTGASFVTVDESTVTGPVDGSQPGRVYVDAIKFAPVVQRSAWYSDAYSARINTAATPVCCVGIAADSTAGSDANDLSEFVEVPILASASAGAPVVGKAITGQRFVCDQINGSFYRVFLTDNCDAPMGWIDGGNLFVFNPGAATSVPAGIVLFGAR
jgi:murein DD-endopeptidase MepM/ murein hydrolase activator NlpD